MSAANWLQLVALLVALGISIPLLGTYMAKVFGGGKAPGDRVFRPIERVIYRLGGIDEEREQRWTIYALVTARVQRACRSPSSTCCSGSRSTCR